MVGEDGTRVATLQRCGVESAALLQAAWLDGFSLLPANGQIMGVSGEHQPLLRLDSLNMRHEGPLACLFKGVSSNGGSAAQIQSVYADVGDVHIEASAALLTRGKELLQRHATSLRKKHTPQLIDGGVDLDAAPHKSRMSFLKQLPKDLNIRFGHVAASVASGRALMSSTLVEGCAIKLAAAPAPTAESDPHGQGSSASLALTWTKLSSLLTVGSTQHPVLELQCSNAELRATAGQHAGGIDLDASVHINAMHTRVQHGSLQAVLHEIPRKERGLRRGEGPQVAKRTMRGLPFNCLKLKLSLGEGSSLQFLDQDAECTWLSSLQSAVLSVKTPEGLASENGSAPSSTSLEGLAVQFEATEIAMTVAPITSAAQKPWTLEKVLAAQLVQVGWLPERQSNGGYAFAGQLTTAQVHVIMQPSSVGAVADVASSIADLIPRKKTVSEVVASPLHPKHPKIPLQVSFKASLSDTLVVAPTTVTVPPEHSSTGRMQVVNSTLAGALTQVSCMVDLRKKVAGPGPSFSASLDDCSVVYCEGLTAQRFPESSAALKAQARATVLAVQHVSASSPVGSTKHDASLASDQDVAFEGHRRLKVAGLVAVADADAFGCALQATDDVLAMYSLLKASALRKSVPATPSYGGNAFSSELDPALLGAGTSGSELDATDVLTVNAERQSAAEAESGNGHHTADTSGLSASGRRQQLPLYLDVEDVKVSLPLSADREMTVQLDAAHVEAAPSRGTHALHTMTLALSMKGTILGSMLISHRHTSLVAGGNSVCLLAQTIKHDVLNDCVSVELSGKNIISLEEASVTLHTPPPGTPTLPLEPVEPFERPKGPITRRGSLPPNWAIPSSPATAPGNGQKSQPRTPASSPGSAQNASSAIPSGYLPYHRAQLQPWLDAANGAQPEERGGSRNTADYLGSGPCRVADVHIRKFELCVPYDREPGPTQRYTEMYTKAARTAFTHSMKALRAHPNGAETSAKKRSKGAPRPPLFPMQLNLTVDGAALRFEHHPMETWLAQHGPMLRRAAVQRHLWEEVVANVEQSDAVTSPLHAGMFESAFSASQGQRTPRKEDADSEAPPPVPSNDSKDQAWEGVMHDLGQQYKAEVHKREQEAAIAAAKGDLVGVDLMLVSIERLQLLAVVCGSQGVAGDAALSFITTVDPPSTGVELMAARKLHIDLVAQNAKFCLGCAPQPFVSADRLVVSGPLAVARQRTAPPAKAQRSIPVGTHRVVPIEINQRGCRAPFKLYTDLAVDARALVVCFTPGYEPFFGIMGLAGKRLVPSDPDKTAPRPPPVPWWDDLRYLWRGTAGIKASPLRVTLAAHQLPTVDDTSPRMDIKAAKALVQLVAGEISLSLHGLASTLFKSAGMVHGGGALLALPFVHADTARIGMKIGWKLPHGRGPNEHHIFPAVPNAEVQPPVVVRVIG